MRGLSGIATAPFRYQFLQPQLLTLSASGKSPLMIGLDGYNGKFENVVKVELSPSKTKVEICFFKETAFEEKRILLAEKKLGSLA